MTKIYAQGNYIVIEANNERNTFSKKGVGFKIVNDYGLYSLNYKELPIGDFNYQEVKKEDGSDYTTSLEFETFLFENTGNFNSGADVSPNVIGSIKITDTAPTTQGLYILSDVGTYTNLGGLVALNGTINYAYFDGNTWSKAEVVMTKDVVDNLTSIVDTDTILKKESGVLWKKITYANIKSNLKTYFDSIYTTQSWVNSQGFITNVITALGYIPLPTTAGTAIGTTLSFITDRVYGTIASPITGNITADVTGGQLGVTNIIIHNSGTAPTFGSQFKKLSGSGNYVTGVVNYIYCTYISATEIIYSINQRT